jgi:hypothetical protein
MTSLGDKLRALAAVRSEWPYCDRELAGVLEELAQEAEQEAAQDAALADEPKRLAAAHPGKAEGPALTYQAFLEAKTVIAPRLGFDVDPADINPALKPHIRAIVPWLLAGGRRALFARFGLQKTTAHLEFCRLALRHLVRSWSAGSPQPSALIALPLGARLSFFHDAQKYFTGEYKVRLKFIRSNDEIEAPGVVTLRDGDVDFLEAPVIHLTNFESIREGKVDPRRFQVATLDEGDVLRAFGATKTARVFKELFGDIAYRLVATATPDPNEYIELLAYAAFLGIMDVGEAKTRFFKRDSTKADKLTLHPHKEREFWLWVASWALFIQKPSDLGPEFSDEGYDLPELDIRWHEIPTDHSGAGEERDGQKRLIRNAAIGVQEASAEKRASLEARVAKLMELRAEMPAAHRILWHDLEDERRALEAAIPGLTSVYGSQDIEEREPLLIDFAQGKIPELAGKPMMIGSGPNFQFHCWWEIFLGIGFKFKDTIQAIHRVQRYGQCFEGWPAAWGPPRVRVDLIYTEAERETRRNLEGKWKRYEEQAARMAAIIREFGLAKVGSAGALARTIGCERVEMAGDTWRAINNDCVLETRAMASNSVDLIITSIPFSTQYEYTPSYNDFGHTDDDRHFWQQMDYLVPELLRVLKPGRVAAIHVKDRIVPGGINGLGFQTVSPTSDDCVASFRKHGFGFMARKTVVTDVVRENNQTYRLGWTEQCKDGTKMGAGLPEYVLLFRKPPTDRSNGYADVPVVKEKPWCDDPDNSAGGAPAPFDKRNNWRRPIEGTGYSRARWQFDAHGFSRSSGDRLLSSAELRDLPHDQLYKLWRDRSLDKVYDFAGHLAVAAELDRQERLPSTFMLFPPHSWHPDVWTDITRMRTLNGAQHAAGKEMHLCLARGTLVLTFDGYRAIEDLNVGDLVLTHEGRWRPVTAKACMGRKPVVSMTAQGVGDLRLTSDHKLWVRKARTKHPRRIARAAAPGWVAAAETLGSYVNLKLPPIIDSPLTEDEWWIVGRWLGDGHIDPRGQLIISCGDHEVEKLRRRLGTRAGMAWRNGSSCQVRVRDRGGRLRSIINRCGRGAAGKLLPGEALSLNPQKAEALLSGYLSADGHYVRKHRRWTASSVSRPLLLGMAMVAQRAWGVAASVYAGRKAGTHVIQGRTVQTKADWILGVPPSNRSAMLLNDGAWKKVRSLEDAGEAEVWDISVADDASFTAEGCIVKNCPLQFDIVDRLIIQLSMEGETVFDPFGGLMTVPYCALKLKRRGLGVELNPGYFRDGVAYLQAAEREMAVPTLFALMGVECDAERRHDGAAARPEGSSRGPSSQTSEAAE